jgi:hypothetical protein
MTGSLFTSPGFAFLSNQYTVAPVPKSHRTEIQTSIPKMRFCFAFRLRTLNLSVTTIVAQSVLALDFWSCSNSDSGQSRSPVVYTAPFWAVGDDSKLFELEYGVDQNDEKKALSAGADAQMMEKCISHSDQRNISYPIPGVSSERVCKWEKGTYMLNPVSLSCVAELANMSWQSQQQQRYQSSVNIHKGTLEALTSIHS